MLIKAREVSKKLNFSAILFRVQVESVVTRITIV